MKGLFDLFVEQLNDMHHSEDQIIKALPKLIKTSKSPALREALSHHLEETKEQVKRLERIFTILELPPTEVICEAMKGLLKEGSDLVKGRVGSAVMDSAIIAAAQKIEHYEIASYTTLHSFAKHLGVDPEIVDLLQETLDEESTANKALAKLADGSFFSHSINREAAMAAVGAKGKR